MTNDTIAAIATPEGSGALGVVRVSGPDVLAVARSLLSWREAPEPARARLARVRDEDELLDEAVAVYFKAPRSYTGEDVLELSCHGSSCVLRRVLEAAIRAGARLARPGEFTRRAFMNGRIDLAQAEGVLALVSSRTDRARRLAMAALAGGLSRRVRHLKEMTLDLLALGEALIDHPDEPIAPLSRDEAQGRLDALSEEMGSLLEGLRRGRLLREGARIAIGGRPNAGKSCLFNALLGTERAIVCDEPGTTRDAIEETADIEGLSCVLTDTAGLRSQARDRAELSGIARGKEALRAADLVLFVIDASAPPSAEDESSREDIETAAKTSVLPALRVLNKSDLGTHEAWSQGGGIAVSAKTGAGLGALRAAIRSAFSLDPMGESEPAMAASLRQAEDLRSALKEAEAARRLCRESDAGIDERALAHLREVFERLGSMLGEGSPEEILDAVFSRFCVGK